MPYDVFSKRNQSLPSIFQCEDLPKKLRFQIQHLWNRVGLELKEETTAGPFMGGKRHNSILDALYRVFCEEHGFPDEAKGPKTGAQMMHGLLIELAETLHVIDIIEMSFRLIPVPNTKKEAIDVLNYRFRENGVGFQFDASSNCIIRLDNSVIHDNAIKPSLFLLSNPKYQTANSEFLDAFNDYKHSQFSDCVVKCGAALESVLKIIGDDKGFDVDPKDTAFTLLGKVVPGLGLDGFYQQVFGLIANIRNKHSSAHGAGNHPKAVDEKTCRYVINATASAIVFLIESAT